MSSVTVRPSQPENTTQIAVGESEQHVLGMQMHDLISRLVAHYAKEPLKGKDGVILSKYFSGVSRTKTKGCYALGYHIKLRSSFFKQEDGSREYNLTTVIKVLSELKATLNEEKTFFRAERKVVKMIGSALKFMREKNANFRQRRDKLLFDRSVELNKVKAEVTTLTARLEEAQKQMQSQIEVIQSLESEGQNQRQIIHYLSESLKSVSELLKDAQDTISYKENIKRTEHLGKQIVDLQLIRNAMMQRLTLVEGHLGTIRTHLERVGNGLKGVYESVERRNEEITLRCRQLSDEVREVCANSAASRATILNQVQKENVQFQAAMVLGVCLDIEKTIASYRRRIKGQWFSSLRKGGKKLKQLEKIARKTTEVRGALSDTHLQSHVPFQLYQHMLAQVNNVIGAFGDEGLAGGDCQFVTQKIERTLARVSQIKEIKPSGKFKIVEAEQVKRLEEGVGLALSDILASSKPEQEAVHFSMDRLTEAHLSVEGARQMLATVFEGKPVSECGSGSSVVEPEYVA